MKHELIATATFGLEAVVRREIENLGYQVLATEDGKITYIGDERAIVRSNLWLRTADRVYVKVAEFKARTFEELFQQTRGISWEDYLPVNAEFPVVGTSVKSALHSVPSCQSIIKKAVVSRLGDFYVKNQFEESGAMYRVRFSILKDKVTIMIDTSGVGLHKRGYRVSDVSAPMKETLAAALVQLSFWKEGALRADKDNESHVPRMLVDTCCGSGTILIEAALMARNIAPGLNRKFASMGWSFIPDKIWEDERQFAYNSVDYDDELIIKGFDISGKAINAAKLNAAEAGVEEDITFSKMDMRKFRADESNAIIITNPPYGERIGDKDVIEAIYGRLKEIITKDLSWSLFMITTDRNVEEFFERKADRRRKLYNGRLQTTYYQFYGEKPYKGKSKDDNHDKN